MKLGPFDILPFAMLLFAGINCVLTELVWFVSRTLLDDRAKSYFSQPGHSLRGGNASIVAASFYYNGLVLFLSMINSALIRIMGSIGDAGISIGSVIPKALFLASYYVAADIFFMTFIVLPIWTARVYGVRVGAIWAAISACMVCIVVPVAPVLMSDDLFAYSPPPPPPLPAPLPAPAPPAEGTGTSPGANQAVRTVEAPRPIFLVFFDLGKDELTNRANDIVVEAAAAVAKLGLAARVVINGNSDTSAGDAPALALSTARALAVARGLIDAGVPEASITLEAFGSARQLVPTGPDVTEPQNRRVEIVVSLEPAPN